jgi:hypothetical protein
MQDGLEVNFPGSETAKARAKALWNGITGNWRTVKITIQIKFSTVAANWILEVSPEDTFADVKQKIFDKYKIPIDDQLLTQGTETVVVNLKDDERIKEYNFQQDNIIKLKLKARVYPLTIYIRYKAGDVVPVGVSSDDTLDAVRARIFDQDVELYDDQNFEYAYNATVDANNIKNDDVLYAQDQKAKVDIPKPMRLKTPPEDDKGRSDRRRKSGEHEMERGHESNEDENEQLRALNAAVKGHVPRTASVARERSVDKQEIGEEEAKSHKSSTSRRTVHSMEEEVEKLRTQLQQADSKLQGKKDKIEEQRKFFKELCQKLGFDMQPASFHVDLQKKIDEIQKRDKLIGGLKKIFEADEIIMPMEDDGHLVASVQELKDFSVEIGAILQVTGDVNLPVYKKKAGDIMEHETRQKETIKQLESEVARLKAVVQEKEANIADLNKAMTQLQAIDSSTEDQVRENLRKALGDIYTYQEEIGQYKTTIAENDVENQRKQAKIDELVTKASEFESQRKTLKEHWVKVVQQHDDNAQVKMKKIEAEKQGIVQQLNETDSEKRALENKHKELKEQYTALEHKNALNERQLTAADQKVSAQAKDIQNANDNLQKIRDELSTTKNKLHEHEQTIATIKNKLQAGEKELARLQGEIREHEKNATTTAARLKQLEGIEKQFIATRGGESEQLKTAHDQINQKDGEIRKITDELASTKSDLSRISSALLKVEKVEVGQRSLIDNLKREKGDAELSITTLKKEIQQLQQRARASESSESRQVMPYHNSTFQGGSRNGGGGGGDNDPSQSYGQHTPHDTDGRGDQASVHFAHLLARLRELLGEEPSIDLVTDLVNVFEGHITTNTAKQALLRKIIPGYTPSRQPMTFHEYLYDYLLQHTSMPMSIQDQLRKLREEGSPGGTQV